MARKPIPPGWTLIAEVQPKSDWDALPYRVCRENATGAWRCDCKGFIFGTHEDPGRRQDLQAHQAGAARVGALDLAAGAAGHREAEGADHGAGREGGRESRAALTTPSAPPVQRKRLASMLAAVGVTAVNAHTMGQVMLSLTRSQLDALETYLAHLTPLAEIVAPAPAALPTRCFVFTEE